MEQEPILIPGHLLKSMVRCNCGGCVIRVGDHIYREVVFALDSSFVDLVIVVFLYTAWLRALRVEDRFLKSPRAGEPAAKQE